MITLKFNIDTVIIIDKLYNINKKYYKKLETSELYHNMILRISSMKIPYEHYNIYVQYINNNLIINAVI